MFREWGEFGVDCIADEVDTRFISSGIPVNLRSIYFAWQKKDVAIPDNLGRSN